MTLVRGAKNAFAPTPRGPRLNVPALLMEIPEAFFLA